jgi:hypothetical protein
MTNWFYFAATFAFPPRFNGSALTSKQIGWQVERLPYNFRLSTNPLDPRNPRLTSFSIVDPLIEAYAEAAN